MAAPAKTPGTAIAALIQPAKLATLGPRGANSRVQKAVYWMATARRAGQDLTHLVTAAVTQAGYGNAALRPLRPGILRVKISARPGRLFWG